MMKLDHRRPIAIDLFAGAGGMSLGFEQAGFDVAAAVELDPVHAATHLYNFPTCAAAPRSVVGLTGSRLRREAMLGEETIDVVMGGPPCQGFSMIGHRVLDDPRNSLVREFLRIVKQLKPTYFVFENVKGLTVGKQALFLDELIESFCDIGYEVVLPWKVLNAVNYETPQDRERLFLLGGRRGARLPRYPDPISGDPRKRAGLFDLPPAPTCREAIGDLPEVENFDRLLESDEVLTKEWGRPGKYARDMRCMGRGVWRYGYERIWNPELLTSSMRTAHTPISRRRFLETAPGETEPISRFFKLAPDGVCNTLRAGTDSSRGAFTSPRPIHYEKFRCITVREMARLHGYPDWFRFHRTKWHGARQIGNSVPPPLARSIALEIIKALGVRPTRPATPLPLGDAKLLGMGMSEASAFWDVNVPIGKRDRKSGAKKRKQEAIEAMRMERFQGGVDASEVLS